MKPFISHYKELVDGLIYVICPDEISEDPSFSAPRVRVFTVPHHEYNDRLIVDMFEKFSSILLYFHKTVVVPDIDEFFVPIARGVDGCLRSTTFASIVASSINLPVAIRALGFNVMQMPDEPDFDGSLPFYGQRRYLHPVTAMNKIAIISSPIRLANGKHFASAACKLPSLSPISSPAVPFLGIINLHMHHACTSMRRKIDQLLMHRAISEERREYFQTKRHSDYHFLKHRISGGKLNCLTVGLESGEVEDWILEWNSALACGEGLAHPYISAKQVTSLFFVKMPEFV